MNRIRTVFMASTLLFVGCAEKAYDKVDSGAAAPEKSDVGARASDEIDFGTIENSTYTNNYFGLSVKFPPEWSVQDQKAQKNLMDMGSKMISQGDKNLNAAIKASMSETVSLFFVSQHLLGTPVSSNPNIVCIAERVRETPGIKSGKDYLFHIRKTLESGQMKFAFPKEVTTEKLGGRDFYVLYGEMPMGGTTVRQKWYATIMKGYALTFTISFTNEEEQSALDNVLSTVTFK